MITVWKYELPDAKKFTLQMPSHPEFLSIQLQNGKPCLWARVDTDDLMYDFTFHIVFTGHEFPKFDGLAMKYLGTFQVESFVYHV